MTLETKNLQFFNSKCLFFPKHLLKQNERKKKKTKKAQD